MKVNKYNKWERRMFAAHIHRFCAIKVMQKANRYMHSDMENFWAAVVTFWANKKEKAQAQCVN